MTKPDNPGQQGRDNAAEKQARNAERQAGRPREDDDNEVEVPDVDTATGGDEGTSSGG